MQENKSRREFLSNSGKMVTAAALFGATAPVAYAATSGTAVCEEYRNHEHHRQPLLSGQRAA
ncbi:hypothetical protein ACLK2H_01925 [Escherichia coli]